MNHNLGRDFVALMRLLPQQLTYLGLVGPRKRQAELLAQLEQECLSSFDIGSHTRADVERLLTTQGR